MTDDVKQFKVRIPRNLKQLVDSDERTNKDVAKTALWREFGGERQELIDMRISQKEDEEEMILQHINELKEDLKNVREQKQALLSKREEMEEEKDAYEDHLEELEEFLLQGRHLDPNHPRVKNAASVGDVDSQEVIEELKERNPKVPDYAFVDGLHAEQTWDGFGGDGE